MSELIYHCSVRVFVHNLKNLSGILQRAAVDAKARNIDPAVILGSRLSPDMHSLTRQIQIATDHAKGCSARLADIEPPVFPDTETSFEELEARLQRTLKFLGGLKASQFLGSEGREIVLTLPIGTLTFSGADYLNGWSLPNFYFHYVTAYNILRHNGVVIGKQNFLGAVPGMKMKGKIAKMMSAKPAPKTKKKC